MDLKVLAVPGDQQTGAAVRRGMQTRQVLQYDSSIVLSYCIQHTHGRDELLMIANIGVSEHINDIYGIGLDIYSWTRALYRELHIF